MQRRLLQRSLQKIQGSLQRTRFGSSGPFRGQQVPRMATIVIKKHLVGDALML